MARYDELPVYKASYDLQLMVFECIKGFPREYKYTLGEKIKNETLELIMSTFRANVSRDKSEHLLKSREQVEVVRLLLRLSKDMKILDLKRFVRLSDQLEIVSKQLSGWHQSAIRKENRPESAVAKALQREPG